MALLNVANPEVALDDGHGMDTFGKRTPIFPSGSGMKSETGNFMHENEFNRAVVVYLAQELKRCGIGSIMVAPGDGDVSLSQRVRTANNAGADLYISVHANALSGKWGNARGIETLSGDSPKSKEIARVIHESIRGGTPQVDRGLKDGSWLAIVKSTNMPAILIEAGFMDNLAEAKLLLSDAYRRETAREIAQGICKVFGKKYIPAGTSAAAAAKPAQKATELYGIVEIIDPDPKGLNLRKEADFNAPVIRGLKQGTKWKCYGKKNGMYDLGSGYVSAHPRYAKLHKP